ncbi:methionyl-tRNA formyltransferase [Candidatus Saccharibacteria bacterium]|jgi:methionyl-tRNA formyltransferase|nr:methionyl-tRNA formyltransferase [Candidatus Saccharibacteria bacterium]
MTKTSKTILFFGTEDFSLITLRALVEAGFNIEAVITKPDARRGRSRHETSPKVKIYAQEQGVAVFQPNNTPELVEYVSTFQNPAGVLVSYGKMIPQSVIDLFSPGIINIHPSILPKYRGPSPIESTIQNGDKETGVSIMQLDARMDAGPIYDIVIHPLNGSETKPDLYKTLGEKGANRLVQILPDILNESILPTPQNDEDSTYCSLLSKDDTLVDPSQLSSQEIERRIRAHLTFPKTRLPFYGDNRIITKSHVSETPSDKTITCKDGSLLSIDELIAPSGKTVSTEEFLRGLHK